jgi:hypothetical protein
MICRWSRGLAGRLGVSGVGADLLGMGLLDRFSKTAILTKH